MHAYFLNADALSRPTNWIGGWTTNPAGTSNTKAIDDLPDGSETRNYAVAEGFAAGPVKIGVTRLCGRPLAAQTISGTVDLVMGALASAGSDFYWKVYLYVTQGSSLTLVRGVLLDYEDTGGTAWPTTYTGHGFVASQTLSSLAVQEGDRLIAEIGYVRTGAGSNRTGTVKIGCMSSTYGLTALSDLTVGSTSVTTLAGFLDFSNTLVRQTPPSNDDASAAIVVTTAYTDTLTLITANREGDEPQTCGGGAAEALGRYHSVWYTWTCPVDQSATVSAELLGTPFGFATCLLVCTGTPGAYTVVDCKFGTAATTESITFAATLGTVYTFMVGSAEWVGGTTMTFTFTPSVAPVAAETLAPITGTEIPDTSLFTAMGWVVLDVNPTVADLHFFAIGDGTVLSPFTSPYVWVGTADDGVTLQLVVDDGSGPVVTTGPTLTLDTFYHWAYVRDGDDHTVYLSTEAGDPLDVDLVIGPVTIPVTIAANLLWFFGSEMAIPKAFKVWTAPLPVAEIREERESYAGIRTDDLYNVTRLQSDVSVSTGGWADYSGYDRRAGNSFVPEPHEWPLRKGPVLAQQAARPLFDDFDSYTPGYWSGPGIGYFPGVVDPAVFYAYPTQPTFYAYIHAGIGVNGTQAFDSVQTGFGVWFEHDTSGYCGRIAADSFRSVDALGRGVGFQISDPLFGALTFGFHGNAGTGDITVYNNLLGGVETEIVIPNVYVVGVYQHVVMTFRLSTPAPGGLDVLADGSWQITVDGTIVYSATAQRLSVTGTAQWAEGLNTWTAVGLTWGGYIDNLAITTDCAELTPEVRTVTLMTRRLRRASHLTDEHQWLTYDKFQVDLQAGVGITDGQGADPQVMVRWSNDGGHTWSNEHWTTAGRQGARKTRVIVRQTGRARVRTFEIVVSDPVAWFLAAAYLDVTPGNGT